MNTCDKFKKTFFTVAVITCFLVCWTPYHAMRIMYVVTSITKTRTPELVETEETLHLLSGLSSLCVTIYIDKTNTI